MLLKVTIWFLVLKIDFTYTLFPDIFQFDLHSLIEADVVKYSGIYINKWLNWKQHCIILLMIN